MLIRNLIRSTFICIIAKMIAGYELLASNSRINNNNGFAALDPEGQNE
jgi:hypothetical protein